MSQAAIKIEDNFVMLLGKKFLELLLKGKFVILKNIEVIISFSAESREKVDHDK